MTKIFNTKFKKTNILFLILNKNINSSDLKNYKNLHFPKFLLKSFFINNKKLKLKNLLKEIDQVENKVNYLMNLNLYYIKKILLLKKNLLININNINIEAKNIFLIQCLIYQNNKNIINNIKIDLEYNLFKFIIKNPDLISKIWIKFNINIIDKYIMNNIYNKDKLISNIKFLIKKLDRNYLNVFFKYNIKLKANSNSIIYDKNILINENIDLIYFYLDNKKFRNFLFNSDYNISILHQLYNREDYNYYFNNNNQIINSITIEYNINIFNRYNNLPKDYSNFLFFKNLKIKDFLKSYLLKYKLNDKILHFLIEIFQDNEKFYKIFENTEINIKNFNTYSDKNYNRFDYIKDLLIIILTEIKNNPSDLKLLLNLLIYRSLLKNHMSFRKYYNNKTLLNFLINFFNYDEIECNIIKISKMIKENPNINKIKEKYSFIKNLNKNFDLINNNIKKGIDLELLDFCIYFTDLSLIFKNLNNWNFEFLKNVLLHKNLIKEEMIFFINSLDNKEDLINKICDDLINNKIFINNFINNKNIDIDIYKKLPLYLQYKVMMTDTYKSFYDQYIKINNLENLKIFIDLIYKKDFFEKFIEIEIMCNKLRYYLNYNLKFNLNFDQNDFYNNFIINEENFIKVIFILTKISFKDSSIFFYNYFNKIINFIKNNYKDIKYIEFINNFYLDKDFNNKNNNLLLLSNNKSEIFKNKENFNLSIILYVFNIHFNDKYLLFNLSNKIFMIFNDNKIDYITFNIIKLLFLLNIDYNELTKYNKAKYFHFLIEELNNSNKFIIKSSKNIINKYEMSINYEKSNNHLNLKNKTIIDAFSDEKNSKIFIEEFYNKVHYNYLPLPYLNILIDLFFININKNKYVIEIIKKLKNLINEIDLIKLSQLIVEKCNNYIISTEYNSTEIFDIAIEYIDNVNILENMNIFFNKEIFYIKNYRISNYLCKIIKHKNDKNLSKQILNIFFTFKDLPIEFLCCICEITEFKNYIKNYLNDILLILIKSNENRFYNIKFINESYKEDEYKTIIDNFFLNNIFIINNDFKLDIIKITDNIIILYILKYDNHLLIKSKAYDKFKLLVENPNKAIRENYKNILDILSINIHKFIIFNENYEIKIDNYNDHIKNIDNHINNIDYINSTINIIINNNNSIIENVLNDFIIKYDIYLKIYIEEDNNLLFKLIFLIKTLITSEKFNDFIKNLIIKNFIKYDKFNKIYIYLNFLLLANYYNKNNDLLNIKNIDKYFLIFIEYNKKISDNINNEVLNRIAYNIYKLNHKNINIVNLLNNDQILNEINSFEFDLEFLNNKFCDDFKCSNNKICPCLVNFIEILDKNDLELIDFIKEDEITEEKICKLDSLICFKYISKKRKIFNNFYKIFNKAFNLIYQLENINKKENKKFPFNKSCLLNYFLEKEYIEYIIKLDQNEFFNENFNYNKFINLFLNNKNNLKIEYFDFIIKIFENEFFINKENENILTAYFLRNYLEVKRQIKSKKILKRIKAEGYLEKIVKRILN